MMGDWFAIFGYIVTFVERERPAVLKDAFANIHEMQRSNSSMGEAAGTRLYAAWHAM
jgi:hypothetical protein